MTLRVPPLPVGRWEDTPQEADETPDTSQPAHPPAGAGVGVTLRGGKMSARAQMWAAFAQAARASKLRWREARRREGGWWHGILNAQPPSVARQCEYAQGRAWVPPGHDGGVSEKAGIVYHALIGRPGVAIGNSVSGICASPFRFGVTFGLSYTGAALGFTIAGDRGTAIGMVIGLAVACVLAWAVLEMWVQADRRHQEARETRVRASGHGEGEEE